MRIISSEMGFHEVIPTAEGSNVPGNFIATNQLL